MFAADEYPYFRKGNVDTIEGKGKKCWSDTPP